MTQGQSTRMGCTELSLKQPLANGATLEIPTNMGGFCHNCQQKVRECRAERWQDNHNPAKDSKRLIMEIDAESAGRKDMLSKK